MREGIKNAIKAITPPIIWRGAKAVLLPKEEEGVKGAEWYDALVEKSDHWQLHYAQSHYYFLWTVIADRIVRAGIDSLLEIGCGSGQLACLLRDKGITRYHGFDFSAKRIEQAKKVCPTFAFSAEDAFQTDLFKTFDYDAVICTEFLEHVEGDLEVLARVKSGAGFYGSVPNFPYVSHVRHFKSETEVLSRYVSSLGDLRVDAFLANPEGKTFYLLEGKKT